VRARATLPGVYLEDLCYDARQAAEKAMNAVLIARGADFPPVHDLARLLTLLTRFAVATRYPGVIEPVKAEEHQRAVAIAEAVIAWAEGRVGKG
jgi:HEPN domain-containing protein